MGVEAHRGAGVEQDLAPHGDRRRLLALHVGHAEAAPQRQLGQGERLGEVDHHLGGAGEALGREHVRADVAVQADERHGARRAGELDRPHGVAVGEVEAELRVVLAGGDVLVRVGVDARRDAQVDLRSGQPLGDERLDARQLLEAVDVDVVHAGSEPHAELVDALVVAVEGAALGRHPGGEGDVQLAARGDVEQQALLVGEAGHGGAEEGLRGVDHPVGTEGVERLAATVAQVLLVVDEHRCAVLGGEVDDAHAADGERAVRLDRRRVGQQRQRDRPAHPRLPHLTTAPRTRSPMRLGDASVNASAATASVTCAPGRRCRAGRGHTRAPAR